MIVDCVAVDTILRVRDKGGLGGEREKHNFADFLLTLWEGWGILLGMSRPRGMLPSTRRFYQKIKSRIRKYGDIARLAREMKVSRQYIHAIVRYHLGRKR